MTGANMLRRLPARGRRALAVVALVAVPAVLALAGCGSLAEPKPSNSPAPIEVGVNTDATDHSLALRDAHIPDPGTKGYPAGTRIPMVVQVWNNTNKLINLTSVTGANGITVSLMGVTNVNASGSASAAPGSFTLPVPPDGNVALKKDSGRYLQINCLSADLKQGMSVSLTFTFDSGTKLMTTVPVIGAKTDNVPAQAGTLSGGTCR